MCTSDSTRWSPYPYQLALVVVRDGRSGMILTKSTVVAPVSSELNCVNCHADDGDATMRYPITPTGNVFTNILTLHDYLNPVKYTPALMAAQPVLCAECHASTALGAPGVAGVANLSNAIHRHHQSLPDITLDTPGCYNCHLAPDTQCLRDTMTQNYAFNCTVCHGTIDVVAQNPSPCANEPTCDNALCHGSRYALDNLLYRLSKGHGGTYCAVCHDSPHALAKSCEVNDALKFVMLQGQAGTLKRCTVCHLSMPTDRFVHGAAPAAP